MKKILDVINIIAQCRRYGVSLWQCPQFLFTIMGAVIIITSIISFLIGSRYIEEPQLVALIVLIITTVLFVISFVIVKSFERLVDDSRLKSEFVNIVSHQLRAPLTNLKWSVEILTLKRKSLAEDKSSRYFASLEENISRMVELVNDLLIVSRIQQGKFPQRKKEVSLEKMTRDTILQFKSFIESLNIKLNFHCQKDLPPVFIDPSQMKIVIENLIDNAVRYTRAGGEVEIRLEQKGRSIYFKIKDSGIGIPKEEQKYIFQKFFRAENALKDETRGSGLGLFITKAIIKGSKGKIWFESKEGKGTTFYFTLPIK